MSFMDRNMALRSALVASAAFTLQGCVAAVFPLAAGGLMAGEGRLGDSPQAGAAQEVAPPQQAILAPEVAPAPMPEPVAIASATDRSPILEETAQVIIPEQAPPASVGSSAQGPSAPIEIGSAPQSAPAPAPVRIVSARPNPNVGQDAEALVNVTDAGPALANTKTAVIAAEASAIPETPSASVVATPEPVAPPQTEAVPAQIAATVPATVSAPVSAPTTGGLVPLQAAPPATAGGTFFDPMFDYAASPGFVGNADRMSAVLVDALSLNLDRQKCADGRSTVLIDLDPQDGKLFPIDTRSASTALASRLADLRLIGIAVVWISQSSAEQEEEIRSALRISGLDPLGNDSVLLMRNSDERKQLRREQLAETSCLIAIAGDERSDFHELYDYLLNPSDARALEPLIGEGWFLIPTPLISERPQ